MLYGIEGILNGKLFGSGEGGSSGGGITLPELTNPAGADQILEGYEAIDGSGNKLTGTHVCESGGGTSVIKGVLTVSADASFTRTQAVTDMGMTLYVDGEWVANAFGIIEGTPIAFCVWYGENSRHLSLTNAYSGGTYSLSAGEHTAIISYLGE